ncbi:hypothetical protein D3C87_1628130 [compost metagenome]
MPIIIRMKIVILIALTFVLMIGVYLIYNDGITLSSVCLVLSSLLMMLYCIIFIKPKAIANHDGIDDDEKKTKSP